MKRKVKKLIRDLYNEADKYAKDAREVCVDTDSKYYLLGLAHSRRVCATRLEMIVPRNINGETKQ